MSKLNVIAQNEVDNMQLNKTYDQVFKKLLKSWEKLDLLISDDYYFRFITGTEDNQIVIGVLDMNLELKYKIISLDECRYSNFSTI